MVTITESSGEQSTPFSLINHYLKGANFIFLNPQCSQGKTKGITVQVDGGSGLQSPCDCKQLSPAQPSSNSEPFAHLVQAKPCWHQARLKNSTRVF